MSAVKNTKSATRANPLGLAGIAWVELGAPDRAGLAAIASLLRALGFSRTRAHVVKDVDLWEQNDIRFLVTRDPRSFAADFARAHGPSMPAMGWWVSNAERALRAAVRRGAKEAAGDLVHGGAPAIEGIGGSRIYLVEVDGGWEHRHFAPLAEPELVPGRGFTVIDHLTNNVEKGTLEEWRRYYREIFGFTDVRSFEIRGRSTGLTSHALRSPCGSFCIPINEGSEEQSQIEEYLRAYRGPGVQHLALRCDDLLASLEGLREAGVETLDIEPEYYREIFERVPNVREDHADIARRQVLVDGDERGYLLQIFTKNVIGPIFFELIQRRSHTSFGEGNFGALFRSIERDQERRGAL
jgi:4-hydroxyphenylpyruvate dioxygenase